MGRRENVEVGCYAVLVLAVALACGGERPDPAAVASASAAASASARAAAIASWSESVPVLKKLMAVAASNAARGKWLDVDENIATIQTTLDEVKGSPHEQSKDWAVLAEQAAALRKKHAAPIGAAKKKLADEDAQRGPRPTTSPWSGACNACEDHVKPSMHDPSSFQHVATSAASQEGPFWVVTMSFRGKNAYGALVVNTKKFWIQRGRVVKTD